MSNSATESKRIYCCGCSTEVSAVLTDGSEVYPHRPDLYSLPFWKCPTCGNFVGCHHKTKDRTRPLGTIPTPEIARWRKRLHALIDPQWRSGKLRRDDIYAALSRAIGRPFHIAEINTEDEAQTAHNAAAQYCSQKQPTR